MSSIDRRGVDTDISYSESIADSQAVSDGWLIFAGLTIVFVGIWNLCEGVIALFRSAYFIGRAVYGDLWFWAIVWIAVAVLELAAGYAIMAGRNWARWFGIVVVGLSALAQLLAIGAYPFWSLFILAADLLILYALTVHWRAAMRTTQG